tara:strand:+ start:1410 stop:4226 length:2817 start_codon:yes stop_codon:yes gene_type:complete
MVAIIEEYYKLQGEYTKKYGPKTIIFHATGSFYEIYGWKEDEFQMKVASDILNLRVASKQGAGSKHLMSGFPDHSGKRFEKILLSYGYTIVFVDQVKNGTLITRKVSRVSSPGCTFDSDNDENDSILASFLLENDGEDWYSYVTVSDSNRGDVKIFSIPQEPGVKFEGVVETIFDFTEKHKINEILVNIISECDIELPNFGREVLVHKKVYSPKFAKKEFMDHKVYQKESLEEYFSKFKTIFENVIDTLDLSEAQTGDIGNMILLLDFLKDHEPLFVKQLPRPIYVPFNTSNTNLLTFNNALTKLQVFSKNGDDILKYIDNTLTCAGKKKLHNLLTSPSCIHSELEKRYDSVQFFIDNRNLLEEVKKHLKIRDLNRIYRRYAVGKIDVYVDIPRVDEMNGRINTLLAIFNNLDKSPYWFPEGNVVSEFKNYSEQLKDVFDFKNIKEKGNVFNKGISDELDELWANIEEHNNEIEKTRQYLSEFIEGEVKTSYNEKNGYYYETTKKRSAEIKKNLDKSNPEGISISNSTSQSKMTSDKLSKISNSYLVINSKITKLNNSLVQKYVMEWYEKFFDYCISKVIDALTWMDVYYSYATVAIEWNYVRPNLITSENSSVDALVLRHPIIEQLLINENQSFIPNDIYIGTDKSYLLYGVNSVGKSSLMKGIGLSVIMAQAGMYVAAKKYTLCPYEKLMVRIGNTDNLFDAHSSFVCEVREASKIVKHADNKTLVIADEFCSSTERESATQIVTTMLQWLSEKKSSYIFATHLFELLETTTNLNGMHVSHLKISIDDSGWTFERKLTDGPPTERNYGAMIASTMFGDKKFLKMLQRNRTSISKQKPKSTTKRSKYNSSLIIKECAICGYEPTDSMSLPLDVHHINMQCTANSDGFIDNYHKNTKSNLVVLCKKCHIDVHSNLTKVHGYEQRDTGTKLKYTKTIAV